MARFSLAMPDMDLGRISEAQAIESVKGYLFKLDEQLRYVTSNLDQDNIKDGAIGPNQLSGDVSESIKAAAAEAEKSGKAARRAQLSAEETSTMVQELDDKAIKRRQGSRTAQIYVGASKPAGHGILWFKPGTVEDGMAACEVNYIV